MNKFHQDVNINKNIKYIINKNKINGNHLFAIINHSTHSKLMHMFEDLNICESNWIKIHTFIKEWNGEIIIEEEKSYSTTTTEYMHEIHVMPPMKPIKMTSQSNVVSYPKQIKEIKPIQSNFEETKYNRQQFERVKVPKINIGQENIVELKQEQYEHSVYESTSITDTNKKQYSIISNDSDGSTSDYIGSTSDYINSDIESLHSVPVTTNWFSSQKLENKYDEKSTECEKFKKMQAKGRKYITDTKWFQYLIMVCILVNCVFIAMEQPTQPPNSTINKTVKTSETVFCMIFTAEMMIKMLCNGLFFKDKNNNDNYIGYFRDNWNLLDFTIVISSWIEFIPNMESNNLTAIRVLRVLRPLRTFTKIEKLKLLITTIFSSLRGLSE
eukprot:293827_1